MDDCKPLVRGIMPRAVEQIMQERDSRKAGGMTVTVQYLQIYQDNVFDLLATGPASPASPGRARSPGGGSSGGGGSGVDVADQLNLTEEKGGEIRVEGAREVGLSASACVWYTVFQSRLGQKINKPPATTKQSG